MTFEDSGTRVRSLAVAEEVIARLARRICCPNRLEDDARLMVVIIACACRRVRACRLCPTVLSGGWLLVDSRYCCVYDRNAHKVGEKGM